jgi:hypothetical protein
MNPVTEMDIVLGRAHPDEMGFFHVVASIGDVKLGCIVSKFLARSDPNRALEIAKAEALKGYSSFDSLCVQEVAR